MRRRPDNKMPRWTPAQRITLRSVQRCKRLGGTKAQIEEMLSKAIPANSSMSPAEAAATSADIQQVIDWVYRSVKSRRHSPTASREDQHGRYLDSGPAAWDEGQ